MRALRTLSYIYFAASGLQPSVAYLTPSVLDLYKCGVVVVVA